MTATFPPGTRVRVRDGSPWRPGATGIVVEVAGEVAGETWVLPDRGREVLLVPADILVRENDEDPDEAAERHASDHLPPPPPARPTGLQPQPASGVWAHLARASRALAEVEALRLADLSDEDLAAARRMAVELSNAAADLVGRIARLVEVAGPDQEGRA